MGKNGVKAKNQLIDFIGLSKSHFCQKWLKIQIGEGIDRRTKVDWAHCIRAILTVHFPDAPKVTLVQQFPEGT